MKIPIPEEVQTALDTTASEMKQLREKLDEQVTLTRQVVELLQEQNRRETLRTGIE